jgi:hypothetical protein
MLRLGWGGGNGTLDIPADWIDITQCGSSWPATSAGGIISIEHASEQLRSFFGERANDEIKAEKTGLLLSMKSFPVYI